MYNITAQSCDYNHKGNMHSSQQCDCWTNKHQ